LGIAARAHRAQLVENNELSDAHLREFAAKVRADLMRGRFGAGGQSAIADRSDAAEASITLPRPLSLVPRE
jgi:hypothetical protein